VQHRPHPLELGLGAGAEQRPGELDQPGHLLALPDDRLAQLVALAAAALGLAQALARLQELLDLALVVAGQLVDRPRRLGGLLEALDLVRRVRVAVLAQALRELVALRGELAERQLVEAVGFLLQGR
jgi:hypothetical protein